MSTLTHSRRATWIGLEVARQDVSDVVVGRPVEPALEHVGGVGEVERWLLLQVVVLRLKLGTI